MQLPTNWTTEERLEIIFKIAQIGAGKHERISALEGWQRLNTIKLVAKWNAEFLNQNRPQILAALGEF